MILTVTLNAALDVTYGLDRVDWGKANRVTSVASRAGGKGINVARVLHLLGVEAVIAGFAGGVTGDAIRADLSNAGLKEQLVQIEGESRRTLVLAEPEQATLFNELGPEVTQGEWLAFVAAFKKLLVGCDALVLSGSLPPGVPHEAYAQLLREATHAGVPALLDTSGLALTLGVAGRPLIAKPNSSELEEAVGRACGTTCEVLAAAEELRTSGAGSVVVTRGTDGLVASTPEGAWLGAVPERVLGNATGAGDAVAAALVMGLVERRPWPDRLTDALAIGAAAVRGRSAGDLDMESVAKFRAAVRLEKL